MLPETKKNNQQHMDETGLDVYDVLENLTEAELLSLKASLTIKINNNKQGIVNDNTLTQNEKT